MDKVRLGIIGTSGWTEMMYLNPLASHPGAEIVALCGRDHEKTSATAARFGIPRSYSDADLMFEAGGLDAVAIVSPDDVHCRQALAAIARGLHVMCEKPMSNTREEAWEMQRAARAAGVFSLVMFTFRWQPHFRHLKALIDAGTIGRPRRAEFDFRGGFVRNKDYQWRLDPTRATGTLGDLGSHMLDMGRWILGDMESVTAEAMTVIDRTGFPGHALPVSNDSATILVAYKSGARATLDVSAASPSGDRHMIHRVRVEGESGAIELDQIWGGTQRGINFQISIGDEPFAPVEVPTSLYGEFKSDNHFDYYLSESAGARYFVDSILAGIAPSPDFTDGARVQDALDAAIVSAREGKRVAIT